MAYDPATGGMIDEQRVGYVAMQDHHGYDYLAKYRFNEVISLHPATTFTMFRLSLTDLERHLPVSLPIDLEINAVVLPKTWLRLYLAAIRNVDRSSTTSAYFTVFVSNVNGYLKRADWVERCLGQCEGVVDSACFLRSGQRVRNMMADSRELSFDEVIRAAFAAVLTVDVTVDHGEISDRLSSSQWMSEKELSLPEISYSTARL